MPEGAEIVFEGEADETPDYEAGDVIVRVRSKKTQGGFVRKDSNLYWKEPISVAEVRIASYDFQGADFGADEPFAQALLGFRHTVKGLDGHDIVLARTGVTQPGPLPLPFLPISKLPGTDATPGTGRNLQATRTWWRARACRFIT